MIISDKELLNKSMVVYLLTDTTNGKQYVGQTQRKLRERILEHMKADLYVDRKLRAHGWGNVTIKILDECTTIDELNECEIRQIAKFNTKYPNGYNMADGGEGKPGHKCSEETKALLSKLKTGLKHSPESIAKMSAATTEQMKDPAVREHLAEINRGKKASEETRKKMSKTRQGRKHTEESKQKISEKNKGKGLSEEARQKLSESRRKNPGPRKIICVETGIIYNSIAEASRKYNINYKAINHVCRGRSMTAGGYHWIYFDDCPLLPDGSIDLETIRGVLL